MWVAKVSFDGSKAHVGSKTLKYKVNLFGFPLSHFYQKNWIIVNITGVLLGEEKNKKAFVKELKNSKRTINFELTGDFFIGTIKEPIIAKNIYNKEIIHLAPALIGENGRETLIIGTFDKKN